MRKTYFVTVEYNTLPIFAIRPFIQTVLRRGRRGPRVAEIRARATSKKQCPDNRRDKFSDPYIHKGFYEFQIKRLRHQSSNIWIQIRLA